MHCLSRGACYLVNAYCDLQEDNHWKKESYQACWLGLVIETRPQYKMTLSETDSSRRESYKQQQVIHFMVERSPSQILRLGSHCRAMTEHHLPLFKTTGVLPQATTTSGQTKQPPIMLEELNKQEVTDVTQDLRKPVRMNFRASSLMSSPREAVHRVQRRE